MISKRSCTSIDPFGTSSVLPLSVGGVHPQLFHPRVCSSIVKEKEKLGLWVKKELVVLFMPIQELEGRGAAFRQQQRVGRPRSLAR